MLFAGKMSYHANEAAARRLIEHVMPRVWNARPDARLIIAGKDPSDALRALASPGRIEITGFVDDLRGVMADATVLAAPMVYAAGIQNKVLEAMASGTPVVTSQSACAALDARVGSEVASAVDDETFAAVVVRLLSDRAYRDAMGAAGRAYVERHHDWSTLARTLIEVYDRGTARLRTTDRLVAPLTPSIRVVLPVHVGVAAFVAASAIGVWAAPVPASAIAHLQAMASLGAVYVAVWAVARWARPATAVHAVLSLAGALAAIYFLTQYRHLAPAEKLPWADALGRLLSGPFPAWTIWAPFPNSLARAARRAPVRGHRPRAVSEGVSAPPHGGRRRHRDGAGRDRHGVSRELAGHRRGRRCGLGGLGPRAKTSREPRHPRRRSDARSGGGGRRG